MQKRSTKNRKADTSRTSNQGRKIASGQNQNKKRGSSDINEDTKNAVKDEKPKRRKVPAGAITR